MTFEELLQAYIGRNIEVFLENNFYIGELLSVGGGLFTVNVSDPTYQEPEADVTFFTDQVGFVRVLMS
jgi:hypothetical protein